MSDESTTINKKKWGLISYEGDTAVINLIPHRYIPVIYESKTGKVSKPMDKYIKGELLS